MKQFSLKSGILLITYSIVLYLALSHLGLLAGAGSYIMTVLRPVIIGVVMAYIINLLLRPMETKWLAGLWKASPKLARGKRGICIVLSILIVGRSALNVTIVVKGHVFMRVRCIIGGCTASSESLCTENTQQSNACAHDGNLFCSYHKASSFFNM